MTQSYNEYSFPLDPNIPPPHTLSQSMCLPPGGDYIQEQYGGGHRPKTPPVELTPTRLRSQIKAMQHDIGIVKEAAIRHQANPFPSNALTSPSAHPEPAPAHPIHNNSVVEGNALSTLPQENIQHPSPCLHDPNPPCPAPLQDMFYNLVEAQPDGWLPQQSDSFGVMDDTLFTALLMEMQEHFMSSDVGLGFTNQPSSSHAPFHELLAPQSVAGSSSQMHAPSHKLLAPQSISGSSSQIAPVLTNVIPPTLLKDAGSSYSLSGPPPRPSSHERGASIDTGNVNDLFADPQDSKDVSALTSGQSFVTGRKSADTSATLEAVTSRIIPSKNLHELDFKFLQTEALWAFPDKYKDILSIHDEVKMLSASPQTVSQCGQEFQKYYQRMFSIADGAAAKFGFETAMVICGKIVNQDASLGQVHTMPGAAEFWSLQCQADDDTIIGHLKAHVYNKTSLAVVEGAFDDLPEDDDEASSKDVDMIPSTEVEGREESLWWFKKEITKRVTDLGGNALAAGGLNIEGYPAHKCLMPGESHDPTAKNNKGIDYSGPEHVETSVAQTRVKKGKNISKARDPEHQEPVMSPCPPACPFKVIPKPIDKSQTPPPACPFHVVANLHVPIAPKAAADEVIELTSASDGSKDTEELDTEYEDDSCSKNGN
ncbi:hypothetical protein BDR07DRAFT_1382668 [Suillus spraguei]|nr:hypothetical protein BDR07DRAFT_1382668 [Suillus spraguei]